MYSGIHNFSEIGKLNKVLLHRPGKELEALTPATLERLLFDDVPYLKIAQQEHDNFARVLRENGFIFSSSDVIAVGVSDEPGGLSMLLQLLAKNSIDIQYMYSIFGQSNGMAYMILRVADPAAVSSLLAANGIQLADAATLGIVSAD